MKWRFTILFFLFSLCVTAQTGNNNALRLWYQQPAKKWTEALPIGNGRLGAMIFGGVEQDRIQFNEETLWTGGPRDHHREGASGYLEQIRKLLREGKQKEAEQLAEEKFMGVKSNEGSRAEWMKEVRSMKGMQGDPSAVSYDDATWKLFNVPTYEGWETEGMEMDGAVWFRTTFDLPADWQGKDLILDLNRVRDHDFTYVNGKLVGSMESTEARRYIVSKDILKPGTNVIAVQVLNYFDKGGIAGYKDTSRHIGIYPQGTDIKSGISLVKKWKYYVQDDAPPAVPRYEADYQPFGDLMIDWKVEGQQKNYVRELNIDNAIARTSFDIDNVKYTREYFASEPDQTIAVHFGASRKGSISFDVELSTPHKMSEAGKQDANTLGMFLHVRNGELWGEAHLYASVKGGKVSFAGKKMTVRNADEVTLYLVAATNYISYKDVSGTPAENCRRTIARLKTRSYEAIKAAHIKEYQQLYNTFSIDLGNTANEQLPTDQRIEKFATASDPSLVSLFLQYGRYLLIASSRPGTNPANLQGIWNDLLTPPWGSKYTTNINAEMNYWPAEVLNLSPMHEPLFKMIDEVSQTGRQTARAHYNARGWVLHHNTDVWRATAPINAANHGIWVTGGAWLCQHLWEHFLFTGDTAFLRKRAYPVMKEAALFFVDFLVKDEKTGWLISTPSNSPENGGLVAGPAMDHQIIRALFKSTMQAGEMLKVDHEFIAILKEKYKQIAPNQIGKHGQLQEWLEDKDDPNNKHRHVSHLWGVHPGNEINWDETPALMKAARQSLLFRGDAGTGWSLAWKINFWARFKDGDHAYKMIQMLISPAAKGGGAYPNLFDAHPPFQIDGNFGGAAGIAEMLVQSHTGHIELLPALPKALPSGSMKGLCARGGFVLDMKWNNGMLEELEVFSRTGAPCTVRYNGNTISFKTERGKSYKLDKELKMQSFASSGTPPARTIISLNEGWRTKAVSDTIQLNSFEESDVLTWEVVNVPHNWDDYHGYRRLRHGNLHGYAAYCRDFAVEKIPGKRYFLFFEGVGSYATVWVNGKKAGYHAGGRTSFTLDITEYINNGDANFLAVQADHPANIKDLPWVCGGCSDERGFSEGSQPFGIFRPVHLVITNDVRIEPFGVHIWNDSTASAKNARLQVNTEIKNYSKQSRDVTLRHTLYDRSGRSVGEAVTKKTVLPSATAEVRQQLPELMNPHLWSVDDPYLYTLVSEVIEQGKVTDSISTPYGIRTISWPIGRAAGGNQFLLNNKPVFINGIAEYEHILGNSHAFTDEQVRARVMMMKAAGFNAFRDAHQPHNLRYQQFWDEMGFLSWTQISAHVWYDTPEFRENFRKLLTEWVKERRNNPSVVLWGLQNESKLPEDFARECTELIRQLDPTASSQRKVVTCNGGVGTDWDVPQNWTGTYGGNPATYGEDLQRQILVGEYGAWRTIDLHTEGPFVQNGPHSEDRMAQLMEMKVRLADSVKDKTAGHFMWLLTSHDNPGRVQGGEGFRELDRIGPVNYKGLLTPWEEPLDVFYMYRSNFAPKETGPMVYIVSHTWPDRWTGRGIKDGITVYSNCDEVELFNDVAHSSLGKKKKGKTGTHFQWDGVDIRYNVLYAIGYVNGKAVAKDYIVLRHLPRAPHFNDFYDDAPSITAPQKGYNYIYRLNCGGSDYTDVQNNTWSADRELRDNTQYGSVSWANHFPGISSFFASQRSITDPVRGTRDWKLFQDFRYGRSKLKYYFPVPDGEYLVELYFTEPWHGTGGGMDCTGWRLFDVAINNKVVIKDLDIWKESGRAGALKKIVRVKITGGVLVIDFPRVAAGQAVISAIAIASENQGIRPAPSAPLPIGELTLTDNKSNDWEIVEWMDNGDLQYNSDDFAFTALRPDMYGAVWIRTPVVTLPKPILAQFKTNTTVDVFVAMDDGVKIFPGWTDDYEVTKSTIQNNAGRQYKVLRKRYNAGETVKLGANGTNKEGNVLMYTVAVVPVSSIEPAYDLKTVVNYRTAHARFRGPGIGKEMIDDRERVVFKKASADNVLEWPISPGVADTYSFTISYNSPHARPITGRLELLAADGTLMKSEEVTFTNTRPGKWNYINSSSGSMINAGNYIVRLTSKDAEQIVINGLDVQ